MQPFSSRLRLSSFQLAGNSGTTPFSGYPGGGAPGPAGNKDVREIDEPWSVKIKGFDNNKAVP